MTSKTLGNPNAISALLNKSKSDLKIDEEYKTVHHSEIISNPQVRTVFDEEAIKNLANSIREKGQQELVTVFPKNENGYYVISTGERRWRALKLLDSTVDIRIKSKPKNEADRIIIQMIENIQREDLLPIEISNALQELVNLGWSQIDISKQLGKSKTYVSRHLNLQKIDDDIKILAKEKIVNEAETLLNLAIIKRKSLDDFEQVIKLAQMGQLTRETTRNLIGKKNNSIKQQKDQIEISTTSDNKSKVEKNNTKKILVINVTCEFDGEIHEGTLHLNNLPDQNEMVYIVLQNPSQRTVPVYIRDVVMKSIQVIYV